MFYSIVRIQKKTQTLKNSNNKLTVQHLASNPIVVIVADT